LNSWLTTTNGPADAHAEGFSRHPVQDIGNGVQMCVPVANKAGKETKGLPKDAATTRSVTTGQPKQATSLRLHGCGEIVVAKGSA